MTVFLTWDEVKNQIGSNCTVLLGNGFSRSYCNSAFNQSEILQHMPSLQNVTNITDIEKCIEETQAKVSNDFRDKTVPKTIIDRWIKSMLHKEFVDTLYSMMPKSLNDIVDFNDDKLSKYRDFFNCFDRVFTLNYDPLLYWMLMRFMNFGDSEYVDYTNLKNELSSYDKNSKNYEKIQKKFNDTDNKCRKSVRTEMYPVYLQGKDYYKMSLFCKGELLLEKNINEAQKMFLIKWEKLSNELYNALENNKNSNEIFKEESLELDKVAESTLNKKLDSVEKNIGDLKINICDGFNKEKWIADNSIQTIFYLHGAFHLMEKDGETIKITSEEASKGSQKMVNKIKEIWDSGYNSLTVLESIPEAKIERIKQSPYLTKCYNEFQNISGTLVTHGLSFMSSDQHIIDAINNNSNLEKIYVGYYTQLTEEIKQAFRNNDKVIFFDTSEMF